MPIDIRYEISNRFGGTPVEDSIKTFARIAPNAAFMSSTVKAVADPGAGQSPCLQNKTVGYARIFGPYAYYDVVVNVSGWVYEVAGTTGGGSLGGGLTWKFHDHAAMAQATGFSDPRKPTVPAPRITPVAFSFPKRMQDSQIYRICDASSAGGILMRAQAGPLTASASQFIVLSYSFQFVAGFLDVGLDAPIYDAFDTPPTVRAIQGRTDRRATEPQGAFDYFLDFLRNLSPVADDFQDPELVARVVADGLILQDPAVLASMEAGLAEWSESVGVKFRRERR